MRLKRKPSNKEIGQDIDMEEFFYINDEIYYLTQLDSNYHGI